ncbi:MAG TPA: hypothetical protein VNZ64_12230 [Candidatus Acidoferrum sp.]|jgi:hypothetical protein|nr:hypothetical protein [Candidatus Acidoferrum sp.]
MITQLTTVKSRLTIPDADTTNDALLTGAIKAVSARFDKETNRTLARTVGFQQEFDPADTELLATCYPIESVTKWETKSSESSGWQEQPAPDHLIRSACVISLQSPFILCPSSFILWRVTYAAGYVLPGTTAGTGQTPLPDDIERAAVEQVAFWFQNKSNIGLRISWPSGGTYQQFASQDLLPSVQAVLGAHKRWSL